MGFKGAETNCRIAHILGILLKNSYKFQILLEATFIYGLSSLNMYTYVKVRWPHG